MDKILIDDKTQKDIADISNAINELNIRLGIIIRVYINANSCEGEYKISKDFSCLERIEDGIK